MAPLYQKILRQIYKGSYLKRNDNTVRRELLKGKAEIAVKCHTLKSSKSMWWRWEGTYTM